MLLAHMARQARTPRPVDVEERAASPGGIGGMLRGSVNSVVGAAGLNLPLRAIERLTRAVEHAATTLERMERATVHLDRVDSAFIDRVEEAFDILAAMADDTRAIRERLTGLERELRRRADRSPSPVRVDLRDSRRGARHR
jgi:hypothetical protein